MARQTTARMMGRTFCLVLLPRTLLVLGPRTRTGTADDDGHGGEDEGLQREEDGIRMVMGGIEGHNHEGVGQAEADEQEEQAARRSFTVILPIKCGCDENASAFEEVGEGFEDLFFDMGDGFGGIDDAVAVGPLFGLPEVVFADPLEVIARALFDAVLEEAGGGGSGGWRAGG